MVLAVQDQSQDSLHCPHRDSLLLCALHVEYMMADAIPRHEGSIWLIDIILLDKGAV